MSEIFFSVLTSDWCKPHQEQQENLIEARIAVMVVMNAGILSLNECCNQSWWDDKFRTLLDGS